MSGNAWEWTSACGVDDMVADEDQNCRRRGGSYESQPVDTRCIVGSLRTRKFRASNTSFRCCANLTP